MRWYDNNARCYPCKVIDVHENFTKLHPAPRDLAAANLIDLKRIIQPIGLVYRAERLNKCAGVLCRDFDGKVPMDAEKLKKLPGVGAYICDALLCYAFGFKTVPIDTNVIRLFSRYFNFKSNRTRPRTDSVLAADIRKIFGEFENTRIPNLAVLDFAAVVCTDNKPKCSQCPICWGCSAVNKS